MSRKLARARLNALVENLSLNQPIRILDVGANPLIEGDVSYRALLDAGHAEVVGFEPQPEALEALNARKSNRETYLPDALGDGSQKNLHVYQAPGFTSVFSPDEDSARYLGFSADMQVTGSFAMTTRALDDVDAVPQVDFLKIDVQGSETEILRFGRSKLAEAVAVQTEVRMFPLYQGEPRFGDLEAELAAQRFEFLRFASLKHVCLAQKHRKRLKRNQFAQAVDGDAFFVRDLRRLHDMSDLQLKKLCVIADAIMDIPDLALFAMDTLAERQAIDPSVAEAYFQHLGPQHLRG